MKQCNRVSKRAPAPRFRTIADDGSLLLKKRQDRDQAESVDVTLAKSPTIVVGVFNGAGGNSADC